MDGAGTGVLTTVGRAIRARRKERSQTLGELARALAVGTEEVSAIEHDERSLSGTLIQSLALALDLDEHRLHARATLVAKLRELHPVPTDRAEPSDTAQSPFADDRRARFSRSRKDIETIAAAMRNEFPVPSHGRISAFGLFERLDEIVLPVLDHEYRVDYAVRRLPYRVEARTRAHVANRTIEIAVSPEAYRDMERGNPRTLFTLCHELGHLVLHRAELVTPDEPPPGAKVPPYSSTEWQAHAFAAAFISPLEEVLALHDSIGSLSPIDVHRQFGCSKVAAQRRLESVEKLLPRRIVRFNDQLIFPFR